MLTCESLSKFTYTLLEAGEPRATIRMPTRPAQARNARFSLGEPGYVTIEAAGVEYRVEYETFDSPAGGARLYRFELMQGDARRASAAGQPGRPRTWHIEAPGTDGTLVERRAWFGPMHFDLASGTGAVGAIRETTRMLALGRRFEIDLPTVDDLPLRAFLFFLAVNATYR